MVTGGVFINAAICGSLSAVTSRYQGRVVWVFIACILVLAWATRTRQTDPKDAANPEADKALS